jgi:hypothetical protein
MKIAHFLKVLLIKPLLARNGINLSNRLGGPLEIKNENIQDLMNGRDGN